MISMDPREIDEKQFTMTRLKAGYDQDEVDNFLDQVALQYRQLLLLLDNSKAQVVSLKAELAESSRMLAAYGDTPTQVIPTPPAFETPGTVAARILDAAQRTSDDILASANADAANIRATAEEQSQRTVAEASNTADQLVGKARAREDEIKQSLALVQQRADTLRQFLRRHLENVVTELEAHPEGS